MTWLAVIIVALIVLVYYITGKYLKASKRAKNLRDKLEEAIYRALQAESEALEKASGILKRKEADLRKDAIRRSQSVTRGRVAEQIAPYLPGFKYDPRDCRFLGSPVDFVIFDGLTEGTLRQVVFVEVKSGKYARLTRRERQVQEVVELKGARYEVIKTSKD